jgi:hypothetical protein
VGEWAVVLMVSLLSSLPPPVPAARHDPASEERPQRHSMFVNRLLIDAAVGIENRYHRPLAAVGVHLAFLKAGRFFVGAPGFALASAPEWVQVTVMAPPGDPGQPVQRTSVQLLRHKATPLITQSFSWQVLARPYGYFYVTLLATKRVPIVDSRWDPAIALSFTPR